jgi:hypothetical protein
MARPLRKVATDSFKFVMSMLLAVIIQNKKRKDRTEDLLTFTQAKSLLGALLCACG